MICDPCQEPHTPDDCIDAIAGRTYPFRHCACQHKPRIDVVWRDNDSFPPEPKEGN